MTRPFDHIWSDTHFGHFNIIGYCGREFLSLKEMHEALVANYIDRVSKGQLVVWLGDAMLGKDQYIAEALADMKKYTGAWNILVRGNHDKSAGKMAALGFDLVTDFMTCEIAGRTCEMSHYPYKGAEAVGGDLRYQDRAPARKAGFVLLHGHTHKPQRRDGNMIHVGVDAWDMRPASYDEIEALVKEV